MNNEEVCEIMMLMMRIEKTRQILPEATEGLSDEEVYELIQSICKHQDLFDKLSRIN